MRKPESDQLPGPPRFEDFRKGDNIEDRRADYANFGEQWEGMKTDIKNAIFGNPALAEVPPSALAKQLGLDDMGHDLHDVGKAPLENLIGAIQDQYHMGKNITGGLIRAIREEWKSGGAPIPPLKRNDNANRY